MNVMHWFVDYTKKKEIYPFYAVVFVEPQHIVWFCVSVLNRGICNCLSVAITIDWVQNCSIDGQKITVIDYFSTAVLSFCIFILNGFFFLI